MMTLFLVFLGCLLLSAFFSGSEMAFVSTDDLKLREMAGKGNSAAQKVIRLKNNPQAFLTGILIGNNIVNISATAILTYWLEVQFGAKSEWLVTVLMTPILLVVGEMVPKDYGRLHGHQVVLSWAGFLSFFTKLLHWPVSLVLHVVEFLVRAFGIKKDKSIFVSEEELRLLIEEGATAGVLGHQESRLIHMILDFERIKVSSVMIPIEKVSSVSIASSVKDVKEIARKNNVPMVLVYEEIPALIVGMVYVFDLLFEDDENLPLKTYLRSPTFLTNNTSLEKAFLTLQQRRQSYAVVTDPQHEVQGVVSIERLLAV